MPRQQNMKGHTRQEDFGMKKSTTLTVYLLAPQLKYRAKLEAARRGLKLSELLVRAVLAVMEHGTEMPRYSWEEETREKTIVYLHQEDKQRIKRYAENQGVSFSYLFTQAMLFLLDRGEEVSLPPRKEYPQEKPGKNADPHKPKREAFVYYLDPSLAEKLEKHCRQRDKNKTQVIGEALQSCNLEKIKRLRKDFCTTKSHCRRSSLALSPEEKREIIQTADSLGLDPTRLINRALYLYL